jgi:Ner family transcriptional regulator
MAEGSTHGGWHKEDIKSALRKKHGSLRRLSLAWGMHQNQISAALSAGAYTPRVEERIAAELGQPLHHLWPDRWTPEGTRRPPTIADHPSRVRARAHRSKRGGC